MSTKEQELNGIRSKMKVWQDSLNDKDGTITQLRIKIQDLKSKCEALELANGALKRTLHETQGELIGLVEAHEQLT
jgi:chromosome segregation ATPase